MMAKIGLFYGFLTSVKLSFFATKHIAFYEFYYFALSEKS